MRWIVPGEPGAEVAEWFGRFGPATQTREDVYLVYPRARQLSVKLRGGRTLDVKAFAGSPGLLDLPGRGRGRMQYWRKWSFPCGLFGEETAAPTGWVPVHKTRRASSFRQGGEGAQPGGWGPGRDRGCVAELAEVRMNGERWWSLGLEAAGPAGTLAGELRHAASAVFGAGPPARVEFTPANSFSYAEWLCQRPVSGAAGPAHA